jgi:hypothetical protein
MTRLETMKIQRSSMRRLGAALGLGGFVASVSGCSGSNDRQGGELSQTAGAGRLALALTASGASGSLYRLRDAAFQIAPVSSGSTGGASAGGASTGLGSGGFGFGRLPGELIPLALQLPGAGGTGASPATGGSVPGASAFLFSEDDPLSTSLEATLHNGDYFIELFSGWSLEKVENGVSTRVAASLQSPTLQFFNIQTNGETRLSYRFETNGDVIDFGQGRLVVDIEVEEGSSSTVQLGEPLDIVGGLIHADSNQHGIQAALYADAAPVGSSIAVGNGGRLDLRQWRYCPGRRQRFYAAMGSRIWARLPVG